MKELSLHILDLVQNSIQAKANKVYISIDENLETDSFCLTITDNGCGMDKKTIGQILDPFFTTKNKKTGLGIPLFKQHAEMTGGNIDIKSAINEGTEVKATFRHSHFDRQPLGDITSTLTGLIRAYPNINFEYSHAFNKKSFSISTEEIKAELEGIPINSKEVIAFITELIRENIKNISTT